MSARDPIPAYVHLLRAKDLIDRDYGEALDVPALARVAFASPKHFIGFEVRTDAAMDTFRWLTVGPAGQPDFELILAVPGPPMLDPESAEHIRSMVAKGALGAGVFATDDCRRSYEELRGRGVQFLTEPTERSYGVEATFRDNSGNWFSLTQRAAEPA